MTQYASPNSDITDGGWTNKTGGQGALNSYCRKDSGDSNYIVSVEDLGSTDTCRFKLQNGDDPYSSADHVVHYRAYAFASFGGPLPLTIQIYDSSTTPDTLIVTEINSSVSVGSFDDYSFTLTAGEANAIEDYDELEIAFTRGAGMSFDDLRVSESWIQYPDGGTPPAADTAVAKNQPEAFIMFID